MGEIMNLTTDDTLKLALNEYAKAICEFLSTKMTTGADSKELLRSYTTNILGHNEQDLVKYYGPINLLSEAERYEEEIRNHPVISKQVDTIVGISTTRSHVTVWEILLQFMTSLIDKQKGLSFSKRSFNSAFKEMMNFFKSKTIQIQDIVPLENFEADIDSIDLMNSWRIERIPEDVKSEWWHSASQPYHIGTKSHLWTTFALIKEHKVDRVFGSQEDERGIAQLNKLIEETSIITSALRLLKKGRVVQRVRTRRVIGWHVGAPGAGLSWNPNIPEIPGPPYKFLADDVSRLHRILNLLKLLEKDKAFQVALRRLNYSVERSDIKLEDRILDTIIGLESLFLGERGELSYRLGLRVALFLGKTLEERKEYLDFMKRSYRLRSTIIHGYDERKVQDDLKKLKMNLHQVGLKLEGLLRQALRKYIEKVEEGMIRTEIIEDLDDRLLNVT
jgi:hypothetical protein